MKERLPLIGVTAGPRTAAFENWMEMARRYGYGITILGRDVEEYVPHLTRVELLTEHLASLPPRQVVFYLDAGDAFVCDGPEHILAAYRSYGTPLVFGAENAFHPTHGWDVPGDWRWANTGMVIGEAGVYLEALRKGMGLADWEEFGHVSDQHALVTWAHLPENRELTTVDHRRVIVKNINAQENDTAEFVRHLRHLATGEGDLSAALHFPGGNMKVYDKFAGLYRLKPHNAAPGDTGERLRIAHLHHDVDNGGASGVADYDNGIWQHLLGVPRVPLEANLGVSQIGEWCRLQGIDVLTFTMWSPLMWGDGRTSGPALMKEEHPGLKIIGIVDDPLLVTFGTHFDGNPSTMELSRGYVEGISDLDAVMCLCRHEVPFYRSFCEKTFHIGHPFPDIAYDRLKTPAPRPEKEDHIWIGLGVGGSAVMWDRNYLCAFKAFEQAKKIVAHTDPAAAERMRGIILSWDRSDPRETVRYVKETFPDIFFQLRTDMRDYLHFLQSCDAVINTSVRDTVGRLVAESAWFGVPVYGSGVPDLQKELFPKSTFSPWAVSEYAEAVAEQILDPAAAARRKVETAQARETIIREYGFEVSLKKFRKVLASIGVSDTDWARV
jgi:glycosyltransferase involved in cell wall biosynthesis